MDARDRDNVSLSLTLLPSKWARLDDTTALECIPQQTQATFYVDQGVGLKPPVSVLTILQAEADVSLTDNQGCTALHWLAYYNAQAHVASRSCESTKEANCAKVCKATR